MKKVVYIYDEGGSNYHRIQNPIKGLQKDFECIGIHFYKATASEVLKHNPDILFLCRTMLNLMDLLIIKDKGVRVIFDIDDIWDYKHILGYNDPEDKKKKATEMYFKAADVVTTTTEFLADLIRPFNENVYVIENQLPRDFKASKTPSKKLRLGLVGAAGHVVDNLVIKELMQLISKRPDIYSKVEFHICGVSEKNKFLYEDLKARKVKVYHYPWLPLTEYLQHYNHIDVLLCPLQRNYFNLGKSTLKLSEAGLTGTIPVGSSLYSEKGGVILEADTAQEYLEVIKELLKEEHRKDTLSAITAMNSHLLDFESRVKSYKALFALLEKGESAQLPEDLHVYSIYFTPDTFVQYTPYYNRTKEKAWRFEYNVFLDIIQNTTLPDDHHIAILSWKFPYKTFITKSTLSYLCRTKGLTKNLFVNLTADTYFESTEQYLDFSYKHHPKLEELLKKVLVYLNVPYEYEPNTVVYANQFSMTVKLWKDYINNWIKPALEYMEGELWEEVNVDSGYRQLSPEALKEYTGLDFYNYVTFILERLIIFFIKQQNLYETTERIGTPQAITN